MREERGNTSDESEGSGPHSLCAVLTSQQDQFETKIPNRGDCADHLSGGVFQLAAVIDAPLHFMDQTTNFGDWLRKRRGL